MQRSEDESKTREIIDLTGEESKDDESSVVEGENDIIRVSGSVRPRSSDSPNDHLDQKRRLNSESDESEEKSGESEEKSGESEEKSGESEEKVVKVKKKWRK